MIRELELRRRSPRTVNAYVAAVAQLAKYYGRSPDKIEVEEIRDYLHYLITERKAAFSTCNQHLVAIRFLYHHVLRRPNLDLRVPAKRSGRLPDGFQRIRHYGLLANRMKRKLLAHCRKLLGSRPVAVDDSPQTVAEWLRRVLGIEVRQCPQCGSPLHCQELGPLRQSLETYRHSPDRKRFPPWDTS
jgi:hypothetical protein